MIIARQGPTRQSGERAEAARAGSARAEGNLPFQLAHARGIAPRNGNGGGGSPASKMQELKQLLAIPSEKLTPEQLSRIREPLSFDESKQLTPQEWSRQALLNQTWNL